MAAKGFDTPDPLTAAVVQEAMAAGYVAAGRYISGGGNWKHLTAAEVAVCKAAGFGLWLIDEGAGDLAQFEGGEAAGHQAGMKASAVAEGLGVPSGTPIFVGVDYSAGAESIAAIADYMRGYAAGVTPYKAGMYADGAIASAVPTACGDFMPGASGWPGYEAYVASGKCALVQHPPEKLFGLDVDPVDVLDESVLWQPSAPAETPQTNLGAASVQTAAPASSPPLVSSMTPVAKIEYIQAVLGVTADGIWGPHSQAALDALTGNSGSELRAEPVNSTSAIAGDSTIL